MRHCLLVTFAALFPSVALASYPFGLAGVLYVLFSLPIGAIGFVVTLVMCAKKQFQEPQVFIFYAVVWVTGFFILLGMLPNETESFQIVLVGDGLILLAILGPAFWQFQRADKQSDCMTVMDIRNIEALMVTANNILTNDWAPFAPTNSLQHDQYKPHVLRILVMLKAGDGAQQLGDYLRSIERKFATKRCSAEALHLIIAKLLALKGEIRVEKVS